MWGQPHCKAEDMLKIKSNYWPGVSQGNCRGTSLFHKVCPQRKTIAPVVSANVGFIDFNLFTPVLIFLDLFSSRFSAISVRKLGQCCVWFHSFLWSHSSFFIFKMLHCFHAHSPSFLNPLTWSTTLYLSHCPWKLTENTWASSCLVMPQYTVIVVLKHNQLSIMICLFLCVSKEVQI